MYNKVIGLALFLAAIAFPLAVTGTATAQELGGSVPAATTQDHEDGGEGPNRP